MVSIAVCIVCHFIYVIMYSVIIIILNIIIHAVIVLFAYTISKGITL